MSAHVNMSGVACTCEHVRGLQWDTGQYVTRHRKIRHNAAPKFFLSSYLQNL